MSDSKEDTNDLRTNSFARKFFAPPTQPMRIEVGAATHPGKVRPNNEDHYAVVRWRRTNEILLTNVPRDELSLTDDTAMSLIVADGIGGNQFGEIASRLVVQRMLELSQQASSWVMKYSDERAQQIRQRVDAYIHEIQTTLRDHTLANPKLSGMGTTWTSAHVFPHHVLIVHLGDSRAYMLTSDTFDQLTRDDTVAQECIDMGASPENVKKFRKILLNALSAHPDQAFAHIYQVEMHEGGHLLLCTDGLTDMVTDDEIAHTLRQEPTPQDACNRLVQIALDNGGKDNVTVVVASITPDASA